MIDLANSAKFSTQADGSNVTIYFNAPASVAAKAPAVPAALRPAAKARAA